MLSTSVLARPVIKTVAESGYFNDVMSRTLSYVEHFLEKDDQSKAEFFRKFVTAVPQFSKKILHDKVNVFLTYPSPLPHSLLLLLLFSSSFLPSSFFSSTIQDLTC